MKTSNIINCYIQIREGEDTPIFDEMDKTGACFVNLDRYLIVPLETPLDEIYLMVKEQRLKNENNYGKEE